MRRLRNKKRLSILATLFLLVFVAGSAYALMAGELEIGATITVAAPSSAEGSVVWYSAVPYSISAGTQSVTGVGTETLAWTVDFDDYEGLNAASMYVEIANNFPHDIIITNIHANVRLGSWADSTYIPSVYDNLHFIITAGETFQLPHPLEITRNNNTTPHPLPDLDENGRIPVGTVTFTFEWEKVS